MSNKLLTIIAGFMFTLLLGIATWWINGVNEHCRVVDQLQFRSLYLVGDLAEAPIAKIPLAPASPK